VRLVSASGEKWDDGGLLEDLVLEMDGKRRGPEGVWEVEVEVEVKVGIHQELDRVRSGCSTLTAVEKTRPGNEQILNSLSGR